MNGLQSFLFITGKKESRFEIFAFISYFVRMHDNTYDAAAPTVAAAVNTIH